MGKPHKHAELIKAWADGAEIEYKAPFSNEWGTPAHFYWNGDGEYRIKPARIYPKTSLNLQQMEDAYGFFLATTEAGIRLCNAAIKRYIDDQEGKE